MNKNLDARIREELQAAQSFVIVSHIRPDGDAIGSMLGFAQALREAGKVVQCVLQDAVHPKYFHLAGAQEVQSRVEGPFDYLIVVDCADRRRTGTALDGLPMPNLVVDHHKTHENFGHIEFVEAQSEATALLLAERLGAWGLKISPAVGACLLTGILTDTLGFRTSNTTANALRVSADIVDLGVDLPFIYRQALVSRTLPELKYWACGLDAIKLENGLIWTALTLSDRMKANYSENDDADLINALSSVSDALITVLFIEQGADKVKVSWRSVEGLDVSLLAEQFGGGGHAAAAGADVNGSMDEVKTRVLGLTRTFLNEHIDKE